MRSLLFLLLTLLLLVPAFVPPAPARAQAAQPVAHPRTLHEQPPLTPANPLSRASGKAKAGPTNSADARSKRNALLDPAALDGLAVALAVTLLFFFLSRNSRTWRNLFWAYLACLVMILVSLVLFDALPVSLQNTLNNPTGEGDGLFPFMGG